MARTRPIAAAFLAFATLGSTLLGAGTAQAAPPGGAPPPVNDTERAATLARPAVMLIGLHYSAVVTDPTGTLLKAPSKFEGDGTCTGFGINPDGYIATAGHCVDTTSANGLLGGVIEQIVQGALKADPTRKAEDVYALAMQNLRVSGPTPGTPVDLKVVVVTGSTDAGNRPKLNPAEVVGYKPITEGDVALLKVDVKDLPTIPVAPDSDVQVGADVLSIGFPAGVDNITDPTLEPSNKDGRISSKKTAGGVPAFEMSAAMSPGMSGGPTVDMQGRLVGINSRVTAYDNESFSFITTSDTLSAFMTSKGVRPEAGRADTMFRSALESYYAGHYTEAITGFDALLAAVPGHPQATQLRIVALGARDKYGDVPVAPAGSGLPFNLTPLVFWSIVGGGGALLLVIVVLLIVRARRRKRAVVAPMPFPTGMPYPMPTQSFGSARFGGPPPFMPVPGQRPMNGPGAWSPAPPSPWQPPSNGAARPLPGTTGTAILPGPPPCIRCASYVAPGAAYCGTCGHAQHS